MVLSRSTRPDSSDDTDALLTGARVLRQRWWMVALTVVVCVVASLAFSTTRDKVYESTASVLFGQPQLSDATFGIQRDSAQPERDAATQVLVATSSAVTERAKGTLRGRADTDDLSSRISVEAAANANVLVFTATASSPREAAAVANAYASGYITFSSQSETEELDGQIRSLQNQLESALPGANRSTLEQRLSTLQSLRSAASGQARLIGAASTPSAAVSPRPKRDAVLACILGLALGVALVFLVDVFDRRVRSIEVFERLYGMHVLAAVPGTAFEPRSHHERVVGFEPYRVLRNSIGYLELNAPLDILVVTSAVRAEGKSTVSTNLARAMALNGQRVVLVECDLRRPSLIRDLGLPTPAAGLATALVTDEPLADVLIGFDPALPNLSLLPAGPLPPNAAELLRLPRFASILAELKESGARVILDAPPLLAVADAQGLLDHPQVDGALLVARTKHTTQDESRRTRAVLDQHRLEPLGLVVTGVEPEEPYGSEGVDPGTPSLQEYGTERVRF